MNLLTAALLETLEASVNLLLQTRPLLRERLQRLDGKSIRVKTLPQGWTILLLFSAEGISLSQDNLSTADAEISGELGALIRLLSAPRSVLFGQGVEISGDAALVQRLQKAMRDAELDWETWLADQIGDLPTAALKQLVTPVKEHLSQSAHSLSINLQDYLQEELAALPARTEYEIWSAQVDDTRNRLEQLERRIARLGDS